MPNEPELQPNLGISDDEERTTDHEKSLDAVTAADAAANPLTEWPCRNGIILTLRRVPQTLIGDIATHIKKPKPPVVVIDEETGQTEANPDSPDYTEALLQWAYDRSEAAFAAGIVYGVKVKHLPEGMHPVESDEWIEDIERVFEATSDPDDPSVGQIKIAREPPGRRFYHWMRYYVLQDDVDLFAVSRVITARTVLTEKEVHQAVESFRYMAVRTPDRIGDIAGWADPDFDPSAPVDPEDRLGI